MSRRNETLLALLAGFGLAGAPTARGQCEVDKVAADMPQAIAKFGTSVAISGHRLVVGTPWATSNGKQGVVYVYESTPTGFEFQTELTASDNAGFDDFGISVAIDGDTILVGADLVDGPLSGGVGAVYAYEWNGTAWIEKQKFQASDGDSGGFFGWSVALEGDTAVVGRYWDSSAAVHAGSAYVFQRVSGTWNEAQKLLPSPAADEDNFGYAIALKGGRLIVGAPERFSSGPSDLQYGRAFVYADSGGSWVPMGTLSGSSPQQYDQFGISVDLDGDELVVGAWQELYSPSFSGPGKAYVFDWDGAAWNESQLLVASDGKIEDEYGASVAIQGDRLLIGAASRDAYPLWGGIYCYTKDASGFTQTDLFLPVANSSLSWLGNSLAMNGNYAVAGAFIETYAVYQSGVAYIYGGFAPWTDLGFALPGTNGAPVLGMSGSLCDGTTVDLSLTNANPSSPAFLFVGLRPLLAPFLGGTLVPAPDLVIGGLSTDASGSLALSATWPSGIPPLTDIYLQLWIADAAGPRGFAASNGVLGMSP